MVLMRRHGATVAGLSLRELTFRTVFGCDNAKLLSQAIAHGHVDSLSPGEAKLTSAHQLRPPSMGRAWDYWVRQVEKAGLMPARRAAAANSAKPKPAKKSSAKLRRHHRTITKDARPLSREETSMADMQSPRLPKLSETTLNPDQRALAQSIASGPRGQFKMSGPFAIYLHSPTFGELAQKLGGHLRFKTSVSPRLSEFAILCTGQQWKAQYEWAMHAPMAEKAGVKPETIAAIQAGRAPKKAPKDEMAIYDFVKELYAKKRVSTPTYNRVKKVLGDAGVVELVGILGYYAMVSMTLNTFKAPLPQGMKAPFKEGK
jgi:4-carboxymuconolactone decarboxylase